jgi:UDP-N-acetylglucosamine 3-dehydrogenase
MSLRAGLVGMGVMGSNHARVLSKLEGIEFLGVVDPAIDSKKVPYKIYNSFADLLDQGIDYCVIAAPTAFHEDLASQSLQSGIPVLIEKPVAPDFESASRILELSEKLNVPVAVGHIERFNSGLQQLKKRLENGELGDVYQIATRRQGPFPARIADVGVVKDLATHDIDLTRWIAQSGYESISAQTVSRSGRSHEDLVSVVGKLKSGVVVNHVVNWLSPLKERKVIVTGEKGTFVVDTLRSDLAFYANGTSNVSQSTIAHFSGVTQGDITYFSFDKPEPLFVEHSNFRDFLLGKTSNVVTLHEGCETVRVADAIVESGRIQQVVSL